MECSPRGRHPCRAGPVPSRISLGSVCQLHMMPASASVKEEKFLVHFLCISFISVEVL